MKIFFLILMILSSLALAENKHETNHALRRDLCIKLTSEIKEQKLEAGDKPSIDKAQTSLKLLQANHDIFNFSNDEIESFKSQSLEVKNYSDLEKLITYRQTCIWPRMALEKNLVIVYSSNDLPKDLKSKIETYFDSRFDSSSNAISMVEFVVAANLVRDLAEQHFPHFEKVDLKEVAQLKTGEKASAGKSVNSYNKMLEKYPNYPKEKDIKLSDKDSKIFAEEARKEIDMTSADYKKLVALMPSK